MDSAAVVFKNREENYQMTRVSNNVPSTTDVIVMPKTVRLQSIVSKI
jgi:hypothetical protein